jgi:anti-sigma regulatory factor (Ser/Thr protein kinase)
VDRTADNELVTLARQSFSGRHLQRLRQLVAWAARRVRLDSQRGHDLALAVSEAASNVIKHGGGTGQLELIQDDNRALIAQISDNGPGIPATAPAALPPPEQTNGRGLYLIRQSCDRVEYHTGPGGTTVHLEIDLRSR